MTTRRVFGILLGLLAVAAGAALIWNYVTSSPRLDACGHDLSRSTTRVIAVDATTGSHRWTTELPGTVVDLTAEDLSSVRVPGPRGSDDTLLDVGTGKVVGHRSGHAGELRLDASIDPVSSVPKRDLYIGGVLQPNSVEYGGEDVSIMFPPSPEGMFMRATRVADGSQIWSVGFSESVPPGVVTRPILIGDTVLFAVSDSPPPCGA